MSLYDTYKDAAIKIVAVIAALAFLGIFYTFVYALESLKS